MTERARRGALLLSLLSMACPGPRATSADDDPKVQDGDVEMVRHGRMSPSALGDAIVAALNEGRGEGLTALVFPKAEYQQRFAEVEIEPAVAEQGPAEGWAMRDRINRQALVTILRNHGGKGYAFVRMESSGSETRGDWVIHQRPRLVVQNAQGEELLLPIVGVMLEHAPSQTFSVLSFLP